MCDKLYRIPTGWEWKKLGDIADIVGGGTPKTDIKDYWNGDIVWLSPTDLGNIGEICKVNNSVKQITKLGLDKSSAKLLPIGTVLFSSRASIGKIGITEVEVSTNQGFSNFICKPLIYNKYLAFSFSRFWRDIEKLSNSTTFKEVSKGSLKEFQIPLPPLEEQRRIVGKLDGLFAKIDKSIALLDESIVSASALMPSALNEVFEELVEKWEKKKLDSFVKTTSGGTPLRSTKLFWNGNIPWLKSGELNDGLITQVEEFITDDGLNHSSAKIFKKGTLLMAMYGATAGKLGFLDFDSSTNQAICAILNDEDVSNSKFIYYFLLKDRNKIIKDSFGGAQPNISQNYIRAMEIPLPPLDIQTQTVAYLDALHVKAEALKKVQQTKKKELLALKASLLESAFKGEL